MSADDTAEYKIKITPDTTAIDDLEKKLAEYAKNGAEVRAKLGIGAEAPAGAVGASATNERFGVTLDSFVSKLSKLIDKIDKTESKKEETEKQEDSGKGSDTQDKIARQIARLYSASSSVSGTLGVAGAAVGSLAGPIGSVVGGVVGDLVGKSLNKAEQGFFDVLRENLNLRVLSEQTGRTTEALYNLKTQAELVGYSLEGLSRTNSSLADELVGGVSPEKAQLLLSAGIDLKELYDQNNGDLQKINQIIFEKVDKALGQYSAPIRAAQLRRFGFSDEEQTARRHLNEPGVLQETRRVVDVATLGGSLPITPANKIQQQATSFLGAQAELEGALRALFSAGNYAMNVSSKLVSIQADVINVIAKTLNPGDTSAPRTPAVSNSFSQDLRTAVGGIFTGNFGASAQRNLERNTGLQNQGNHATPYNAPNKAAVPR